MSADRLAEIKARAEAATPGPSMVLNARLLSGDVFIEHAREDVPWLVEQVERAEAEVEWWKERFPCDGLCSDAPEEDCSRHGRVPADLWGIIGKLSAERDALAQIKRHIDEVRNGTGWTVQIYADKAEAERDALRETVGRVQALVDSNPDHADTCGSVLTPGADYPCSCWQTDLRAALATTGEGHVPALIAALWEARETNARLNRRAQITEAAIADLTREPAGGRKHRAVAAEVWERCEESHGLACRTTREAWAEVRRLRGRLLSDEPPMTWCAVCGRPIWEGDRLCCGTRNGAPVGSAAAAETGSAPFPHSGTPATVEAVSVAHSDGGE